MGLSQGVVWIHDKGGERPVSPEGDAIRPMFSAANRKIYYLLRRTSDKPTRDLWVTDLVTGKNEPLVTGFDILRYDVSPDQTEAAVSVSSGDKHVLWLVPLGGNAKPRQIAAEGDHPFFRANGEIIFQGVEGKKNYLYKTNSDHSRYEKVTPREISTIRYASEDGEWVMAMMPSENGPAHLVIPVSGGEPVLLCAGACIARWSPDGRFFQITFTPAEQEGRGETFIVPLAPGQMLPPLPSSGLRSAADLEKLPGVLRVPNESIMIGSEPGTYSYVKTTLNQNIYRIALPR
jgi:hypothetical protein